MAQTYEIDIQRYNGTDYDILLPTPNKHASTHKAGGTDALVCETGNYADGSVTYEKLASDAVKLQFLDVSVSKERFVSDSTYSDYPYRASVPLTGVLTSMVPEVILSLADATSGNYAPVAACYNGGAYLYAASAPEANITIPTILIWRGA